MRTRPEFRIPVPTGRHSFVLLATLLLACSGGPTNKGGTTSTSTTTGAAAPDASTPGLSPDAAQVKTSTGAATGTGATTSTGAAIGTGAVLSTDAGSGTSDAATNTGSGTPDAAIAGRDASAGSDVTVASPDTAVPLDGTAEAATETRDGSTGSDVTVASPDTAVPRDGPPDAAAASRDAAVGLDLPVASPDTAASRDEAGDAPAGPGQGILLQAEDYARFSDSSPGNQGNAYRTDDVDIESCSEGGYNVAWITNGEWLEFDFTVARADTFNVAVRVACPLAKAQGFQLLLDDVDLAGWVAVPSTVSWQTWQNVTVPNIAISAGSHRLRIVLGGEFNLNYLYIASATNPPPPPELPGSGPAPVRPASYQGAADRYGQLRVVGKSLVDANGNPVQLRGISSHGLQWFPFFKNHTIPNLAYTWGIDVIRPAMYVEETKNGALWAGYLSQPEYMKQKLTEMIEDAIAVGIYVFIDWHIHNNPANFTSQAITFFREMATRYGSYPNVIYEICNEPEYVSWDIIKGYANTLIPEIRSIDPDNLILVGPPNWCQDLDTVANAPLEGFSNIMYSLHFYAGSHGQALRDKADYALGKNLPVFVSEWGMSDNTGGSNQQIYPAESRTWLDWVNQRGLSWINWSFSNKAEGSAALLPGVSLVGPWADADLSASGKFVKAEIGAR